MNVIGFAGYSGAGKTTLVERMIPLLREGGLSVSVVKHAHHKFDIDHPGKDTWRHREAGAFEVVVASDRRLALIREFAEPAQLDVHQLIAELRANVDWVLVEGFKHSSLPKIEVWRPSDADEKPRPARYVDDPQICAIATDAAHHLPQATTLPLFDLNDAPAVARWLIDSGTRFAYHRQSHG